MIQSLAFKYNNHNHNHHNNTSSGNNNTNTSSSNTSSSSNNNSKSYMNNAATSNSNINTSSLSRNQDQYVLHQQRYLKTCQLPTNTQVFIEQDEHDLITRFITEMRHHNVDFYIGYEIQQTSFGYLLSRSEHLHMAPNLLMQLSKIPTEKHSNRNDYDIYAEDHDSGIFITGKIIINVWKIMKSELKLMDYSYNNVCHHLLKHEIPRYTNTQLTKFYRGGQYTKEQKIVIHHMIRLTR